MALITSPMLQVEAQAAEYKLPELEITARAAKPIEGAKCGGQVDVVLVDPGVAYEASGSTLKDVTGLTGSGTQNKRSMLIRSVTVPTEVGSLAKVTDIDSWTREFADPNSKTLQLTMHNRIMTEFMFGVNSAQVVNSAFGIEHLGIAAGYLGECSVSDLWGFMSPTMETKLGTDVIKNYFLAPSITEPMYADAKVGRCLGIMWERCKMPSVVVASANVMAADWAIDTAGVNAATGEITIDDNGSTSSISTSTVIKAGQTFTFAGIYALDQQNQALPYLKTFVVQEQATGLVTGKITLKVGALITTGGGANVSTLPVATNTPIPGVGASVGVYSVLLATQRENLLFEPVHLDNTGFQDAAEGASDSGNLVISSVVVPDGNTRTSIYRLDAAYVVGVIDTKLATAIYVKQ